VFAPGALLSAFKGKGDGPRARSRLRLARSCHLGAFFFGIDSLA